MCSTVVQNIQIFCRGPVMFIVTCYFTFFSIFFKHQVGDSALLFFFSDKIQQEKCSKISLYFNCHVYDVLANQWKYCIKLFLRYQLLTYLVVSMGDREKFLQRQFRYMSRVCPVVSVKLLSWNCLAEICI